jgi:MFS superfamily sulfate permease-like transporter
VSVTALTALIVAVTGLVSAVVGGVVALVALFRKQAKVAEQVAGQVSKVAGQVDEVHHLVNNQLDRQMIYNQQLTGALIAANVAVPEQERPPGTGGAGERLQR